MKCAVISSPQGGITEIIENGKNGILVNNYEELEFELKKLIKNKALRERLANALEHTIKNKFLWNVTSKKIINDINERINSNESKKINNI